MRTLLTRVGRLPRPDLVANQRGRAALSSSANPLQTATTLNEHRQRPRRCLTDDDRTRYPAPSFTSPTERAGAPEMMAVCWETVGRQLNGTAFPAQRPRRRRCPQQPARPDPS